MNLEESGLSLVEGGMEYEARRQLGDDGVF